MYCTNCGALNKDDAKFCVNCSESLSDAQIEERLARSRVTSHVSYLKKVNPSAPQPESWGLPFDQLKAPSIAERLGVDPERRFSTLPLKAGFGGVEWVNFFRALFDFSFNHFIGVRVIKLLFGISIFGASLMALLFVIAGFQASKVFGFFSLFIGAPLIILLVVIYSRILLETMLVVSRISGHMAKLRMPKTEEKSQSGDSIQWNV